MFPFTKESVVAVVRTAMAYVYASILTPIAANFEVVVPADPDPWVVAAVGTVLYQAIRWAAEKIPAVGWLLVFNTKPHYADVQGDA